jgi:hypothetical protein
MSGDIFGLDSARRLRKLRESFESNQRCTSWYGHDFKKFDSMTLFCPTCGATKTVAK